MGSGKPLAFDLGCGLGGWTEGLKAVGYHVIGFDIEKHEYDGERYPGTLWIQDVRTIHGSQLRGASLIVASMPCTEFSYMAMPWRRAKQIAAALRGEGDFPEGYRGSRTIAQLTELFDACFRIQREACEAAGRHIPMVVENVKGAQPWVGAARWAFGSYYLWGDVPALMPAQFDARKVPGFRFDGSGRSFQTASVEGMKNDNGGSWLTVTGQNLDGRLWKRDPVASCGSKSPARKAASARIAKIPLTLSTWIGRAWLPDPREIAA